MTWQQLKGVVAVWAFLTLVALVCVNPLAMFRAVLTLFLAIGSIALYAIITES